MTNHTLTEALVLARIMVKNANINPWQITRICEAFLTLHDAQTQTQTLKAALEIAKDHIAWELERWATNDNIEYTNPQMMGLATALTEVVEAHHDRQCRTCKHWENGNRNRNDVNGVCVKIDDAVIAEIKSEVYAELEDDQPIDYFSTQSTFGCNFWQPLPEPPEGGE